MIHSSNFSRDTVDSGISATIIGGGTVITPAHSSTTIIAPSSFPSSSSSIKERTMSVCSVAEEEDEPISLLGERCRYTSLSEEDEKVITTEFLKFHDN